MQTVVSLPDFNLDTFFEPISNNPNSPYYLFPYSLITKMPRSVSSSQPAFFQVGVVKRDNTVQEMCIPSLANIAPTYARMSVHYVVACIKKLRGEDLLSRLITKEASVESQQFEYDLNTHTVKAIGIKLPDTTK
eukprot:3964897-Ditylum_brightwellii.AAC.1